MLVVFLVLLFSLIGFFVYTFAIKPLTQVRYLKESFQKKGYKVLVLPLNFLKERTLQNFKSNFEKHGKSMHYMTHDYQGYDFIISNAMNRIIAWVANPDLIKDASNQMESIPKVSYVRNNLRRMNGGGLLQSEGKQWKGKRRIYSQIFNFKLLEQLHKNIDKVTEQTISKWDITKPLDVGEQMRNILFNIFVISYFGRQFQPFSYKNMNYCECIVTIFSDLFKQSFSWKNIFFGVKTLQMGLTQKDRQVADLLKVVLEVTKSFVLKRYEEIQKNNENDSILSKIVFNEHFKNLSAEQKATRMEQITGDILLFFFAGTDTTSTALTTTFHLLAKNVEVQQKLLKQLQQNGNICEPSNIKKLKYFEAVMNQSLRLYGPANSLSRREVVNQSTKLGDVTLPQGMMLIIEALTIHHSQKYYKDPEQFIPERWLSNKNEHPFSFMSFGTGARNCIGQYLARMEYKIVLSKVLKKFTFTTNQKHQMKVTMIYQPAHNKFDFKVRR